MHATQDPVSPATTPTVADTLRRAALYLIRHGWTQDHTYDTPAIPPASDTFPATDVLGALVLAVTGRTLIPAELVRECDTATVREFNDAAVYLARWLGLLADTDPAFDTDYWPTLAAQNLLWKWNDSPWQDQAHVVDGLLCAAADADGTVYLPDSHRPYAADFAALGLMSGGAR